MILSNPPGFRLGDLIPGRGCSRCYRCHRPWWATTPRIVDYTDCSGQFALCVRCWDRATVADRMEAHMWLCAQTRDSKEETAQILRAVRDA